MSRFENLSPIDFENLVRDLFTAKHQSHFESFAIGRDGGIDSRHIGNGSQKHPEIVIQCKHYETSGFSNLKSKMIAGKESAIAIGAVKYLLVTTVSMPQPKKTELKTALAPLITSEGDIYGREDIDALLRDYPAVEKAHFRLWIGSTAILESILHSEVYTQTNLHLNNLKNIARTFVDNSATGTVKAILEEQHACIISGPAGVGKTTLANMLLLDYIMQGFEPVIITRNLSQGLELYAEDRKQVFLYDDFLGRVTDVENLDKNEDTNIVNFITSITRSGSKRFILTTRQYILARAKEIYEQLDSTNIRKREYFFEMKAYTKADKAHILYNHLYFSTLSSDHRNAIVVSRRYTDMIESGNFTPRAVETAINLAIHNNIGAREIADYLVDALEDPRKLWRVQMTQHLSGNQKTILAFIALSNGITTVDQLERFYISSIDGLQSSQTFESAMSGLEGSMLDINSVFELEYVRFLNPGVEDAVLEHLLPDRSVLMPIARSGSYAHLLVLWNHANDTADAARSRKVTATMVPFNPVPKRPGVQAAMESLLFEFIGRSIATLEAAWAFASPAETDLNNLLVMTRRLPPANARRLDFIPLTDALVRRWHDGLGNKENSLRLLATLIEKNDLLGDARRVQIVESLLTFVARSDNDDPKDFRAMIGLVDLGQDLLSAFPSVTVPISMAQIQTEATEAAVDAWQFTEGRDDLLDLRDDELIELREETDEWASLLNDLGLNAPYEYRMAIRQVERAEEERPEEEAWDGGGIVPTPSEDNIHALFASLTDV